MVSAYVALIASSGFALVVPRLLGNTVDEVLRGGNFSEMVQLAVLILLVSAGRGIFAYGQTYLSEWTGQLVAYDLRNSLFNKLQRLSFSYHDGQQTGDQMSRATADVEALRNFVQGGLLRALNIFILVFGAAGLLFFLNWRLALVGLLFVPIVAYRSAAVSLSLREVWTYILRLTGKMTTVMQENLAGARVVRAFGAQEHEKRKFDVVITDLAESHLMANRKQVFNSSFIQIMFGAATAAILWFGGMEIVNGRLTPGELTQFIFYLGLIQGPVRMSGMILNNFSRAISAGQRIFEVLDAPSPVADKEGAVPVERVEGRVRFETCRSRTPRSRCSTTCRWRRSRDRLWRCWACPGAARRPSCTCFRASMTSRTGGSRWTGWTCATSRWSRCGATSASQCRTCSCSRRRWPTTSHTAAGDNARGGRAGGENRAAARLHRLAAGRVRDVDRRAGASR